MQATDLLLFMIAEQAMAVGEKNGGDRCRLCKLQEPLKSVVVQEESVSGFGEGVTSAY